MCQKFATVPSWLIVVLIASGSIQLACGQHSRGGFPDLPGNFCRNRLPTECCKNRRDECSVPVEGTLCYCDEFCDRRENPDCCPDFWEVCKGHHARSCYKDGRYIPHGKSHKINCNECLCRDGKLDCNSQPCMIDEEIIEKILRSPSQYGWKAGNYSEFWGRKAQEGLVLKTGTLDPEVLSKEMFPIKLQPDLNTIPKEFDARTKREWQGRISDVNDQGWCGASWAFSTLSVAQDRLAIESSGKETVWFSAQHLLSCDRRGQRGCNGGHVDRAWQYLRKFGVVNEECFTYESGKTGKVPKCPFKRREPIQCTDPQERFKREDLYSTEPAYRISGKEEDIQWEIMNNGPVQAMIEVHRDLFMYKSGVYSYSGLDSGKPVSHSVRIIGWGVDYFISGGPIKYWLVANSWGRQWGERGYFRIRRGTNESEVESFVIAVRAHFGNKNSYRRRKRNKHKKYHG